MSSACKNVPQRSGTIAEKRKVPFGETRASILRLNLRKKTSSNWMLPETREYLTKKQDDFRKPRRKGNCVFQNDDAVCDVLFLTSCEDCLWSSEFFC